MTQGRKRMLWAVIVLVALLGVLWIYLTITGQQSENMGYLVHSTGDRIECGMEYGAVDQKMWGVNFRTEGGLCYG